MAIVRPVRYVPGAFKRQCDICGMMFLNTELVRGADYKYRCLRYCEEQTMLERDEIATQSQMRREAPPPPHGIPFDTKSCYPQERLIFDFQALTPCADSTQSTGVRPGIAPTASAVVSNGPAVSVSAPPFIDSDYARLTGEAMRYLAGIIVENKKPPSWIAAAKTKLRALADFLISKQFGFGFDSSSLPGDVVYGHFTVDNVGPFYTCENAAGGGLGLLLAYQVLGDSKYLASAQAAAHAIRNMQASSLLTARFTSSDAAGTAPLYTGGICDTFYRVTNSDLRPNHLFYPSQLLCLEFWYQLLKQSGDMQIGATGTIAGLYTKAPQQLLSRCIADLRACWSVGIYDAASATAKTGLSAVTPYEVFNAFPAVKASFSAGTGNWEYRDGGSTTGTLITSRNWARALRSLYAYEGFSTQVSSCWNWLRSFTSNPTFQLPAGLPSFDAYSGNITALSTLGIYSAILAPSTLLLVRQGSPLTACALNGSSLYDFTAAGYLAAIQSAQDSAGFRALKDTIVKDRFRLPVTLAGGNDIVDSPMLRGRMGLSGQMGFTDAGGRQLWFAEDSAVIGGIFRLQPQAYYTIPV